MKIHEYQGKELLKRFGVAVPRGVFCQSADAAVDAAKSLGGQAWLSDSACSAASRPSSSGRQCW